MNKSSLKYILWLVIGIGMITASFLAWQRYQVEAANQQVELAVDWSQVKSIARKENLSPADVLTRMKGTISGLVFKEETVKDLQTEGKIIFIKGTELYWQMQTNGGSGLIPVQNQAAQEVHQEWNYLLFSDAAVMERVAENMTVKNNAAIILERYAFPTTQGSLPMLGTSLSEEDIVAGSVGFDDAGLELAASQELHIIPQIRSWQGVNPAVSDLIFGQLQGKPVSAVFFNDESLPGIGLAADKQKEVIADLAARIAALKVPVGMVEFFPQKGMQSLAQAADDNMVRMHTIRQDEMAAMVQSVAVDRFTLAATDRDIRVLFVRFFPTMSLHDNLLYIDQIKDALGNNGFRLGQPAAYAPLPQSTLALILLAAAVAAGGILLLVVLGYVKSGLIIGILGFLAAVGLILTGHASLARKGLALLAVVIFPILSITSNLKEKPAAVLPAVGLFLRTTIFSLLGAVLMVGLLADRTFMYTLDQFMGVKLAHAMPLLLILLIFWFLKDRNASPREKIVRILDYPIQVKYLALLGFLMLVLAIYLLRTGNDNAAVPAWELAMRSKLEYLLSVRPRTKEFLIGHPLMILMFYLGYRDRYLPLLLIAVIGQVSIVNTFAHIHTPLLISLHRAFNGVWLGTLIGLGLIFAYWLSLRIVRKIGATGR